MLHSFSSRYFLVVGIHCDTYRDIWKKKQIFSCNNILNVVQLLKKTVREKNMQISSHHESNRALKNDSKMMTTMSVLLLFFCMCVRALLVLQCIFHLLLLVYTKLNNVLGCCVPCNKRLLLFSFSVKAHSIHYQYL